MHRPRHQRLRIRAAMQDSARVNWGATTDLLVAGYQVLPKWAGERDLQVLIAVTGSIDTTSTHMADAEPDTTRISKVKAINGVEPGALAGFVRTPTKALSWWNPLMD